ncbi:restriction endonuclease subunit S [Citrobacter portucalensis]|uniref:Restriction endonuclease subunit S n=2 Tax=Buttiauxella TaxID=82976 RepID=A0A3N5DAV0_9ENTR|nr:MULTISPECIES: restriction endonuclease subunit S [Enterobacteriaceae]OAT18979.1 type I restriction-modification system, specificity subunit S [Buttiauxella noackiae ATCC 51607]RHH48914.1 restriction endonuclease subunit S [Citrobacter portucalensis]RPH25508.1 restriction endonuclease subunit S [Buttiauxella warmboldiae]
MAFNYEINQLELMQARIKSVPHGWQFTYVGKAFCIRNNLRKPISEEERSMSPGNYPYYGPTKIQGYIGAFEQDGSYALIGEDGDHFLKFEKYSMTQLVDGKCTVNNHAHIIEGTKEASREWFYYYFMHRDIFSFLSRQGAGRYKLNKASLEKMPLLLPPIVEQKKIAQILSTWDKAITVTEKLLANSQQQKKALMQQLITGEKRLLDENGVRFSGKWKWLRAAELFKTISQKNNSEDEELLAVTQDLGVIPRSMLERRVVMPDGSTKGYKLVVSGNFIISLRSFQGGLEYSRYRGLVSPAYTVLTPIKKIVDEFYMQYYKSYNFIGHLAVAVIGIRDGKQISYEDFSFLKLPYPEIEEQQKIATVLSAADDEIATLEKKLACLKDEKKALMQQLLTGKRRVKIDEAVAA